MAELTQAQIDAAEIAREDPVCRDAVKALRDVAAMKERAANMEAAAKGVLKMRFAALGAKEAMFDGDVVAVVNATVARSLDKAALKILLLNDGFSIDTIRTYFEKATRETEKPEYVMFRPKRADEGTE